MGRAAAHYHTTKNSIESLNFEAACWRIQPNLLLVPWKASGELSAAKQFKVDILGELHWYYFFSPQEFRKNLKGVNGGKDFEQDILEDMYHAIK